MKLKTNQRISGWLIAGGACLSLLVKMFWLLQPSEYFSLTYRILGFVFGNWLPRLIMPVTEITFSDTIITSLIYLPYTAIVTLFLLWNALKIIQARVKRITSYSLPAIGLWLLAGFILDLFSRFSRFHSPGGIFYYFNFGLWVGLPNALFDLATVVMIVGIGYFVYNKFFVRQEMEF